MDEIKLTIKAICGQFNMTIAELEKACGIKAQHLNQVSSGNVKMTADDLAKISNFTKIPMHNIEISYRK